MTNNTEIFEFDVIIIGAGIIGLAIAHKLSTVYNNVLLIEKENSFGHHISSRNSEVIHSGIYYNPTSLKAKLCYEGNKLLYDFAKQYKINHKNCGKIIIASKQHDLIKLDSIMKNGLKNGLKNMKILNANEVKKKEPLIKSIGGLWVPSSGIIDSHGVMQTLEYLAKSNDAKIVYNTEVIDISYEKKSFHVSFKNENYKANSKILINSAGLWCDKISNMVGVKDYKIHYCKGEYYKTSLYRNKIQTLIYPTPTKISLGCHIVLRLDGSIGFGPSAYYVDGINYKMDNTYKKDFLKIIQTYLDINSIDISEDFSGIRPKIQKKGEVIKDFIIKNEVEKGYKNFINLIGIESPGLTSSLSIAKYVKKIII
tara:strand:- start:1298 stop:2401 length:1104 start_codon:yes stop_codon:yes gene_type:complete